MKNFNDAWEEFRADTQIKPGIDTELAKLVFVVGFGHALKVISAMAKEANCNDETGQVLWDDLKKEVRMEFQKACQTTVERVEK